MIHYLEVAAFLAVWLWASYRIWVWAVEPS